MSKNRQFVVASAAVLFISIIVMGMMFVFPLLSEDYGKAKDWAQNNEVIQYTVGGVESVHFAAFFETSKTYSSTGQHRPGMRLYIFNVIGQKATVAAILSVPGGGQPIRLLQTRTISIRGEG